MDRPITSEEAGARFSELLRDVVDGESYVVTDAGKPVARITPLSFDEPPKDLHLLKTQAERIQRMSEWLKTRPITVTGPWTRDELYER